MVVCAGTPMASRNLPPSFFNAHYHAKLAGYSEAKLAGYSHPEASGLYSEAYTQVCVFSDDIFASFPPHFHSGFLRASTIFF